MSVEKAIRGVLQDQIAPKEINEAGHDDVSMAKTKVKVAMAAIQKMSTELDKLPDDGDLPSWWVGKVAIAVDKLDGMADYLDTQVEEVEEELEEKKLTPAELKKREEVAKAIERENPKMPMDQKMAIATATAKKVAEATVNTADIEKHKNISQSDKDKIAKIADMMSKEKKPKTEGKARDRLVKMVDKASGRTMADREKDAAAATASRKAAEKDLADFRKEAYDEPQGQAKRMMSPLQKARMDKEKADRDRDGKLKPGVVKVKKEEVEVEEAKKVSSMQIHKVLAKTKNSREGIAALKKAFRVNDMQAKKMLNQVMNEETIDEISRSMTPMSKRFGKAVDPKKFDAYKKHVKQHGVDEPTVRFIDDNPNHNQSKRAMQDKHVAQAVKLYKAAHKESVDEVLDTPDRAMNYKHRAKYSRDRARNSQAAHMLRGTDPSKDKNTERKRERGLKTLNRNIAGKIRKSMMNKEETVNEKFANPAQQAAVMAKLKASGKYKESSESAYADDAVRRHQAALQNARAAMKNATSHDQMVKAMNAVRFHQRAIDRAMHSENTFISKFKEELKEKKRMNETKGAPKGYHFTRSGQLKKGDAGQDGPGGKMLRSDPLDKQRKKIPPLPENDK